MKSLSPFIPSRYFPSVDDCDEDGLLAVGGCLDPEYLIDAYAHGIFPWPTHEKQPMLWWSPDPRAVIDWERVHFSRRLLQTCRGKRFDVTFNTDFKQVIRLCAETHLKGGGTWVTPKMIKAYTKLHEHGYAKSIEVWHDGQMAGRQLAGRQLVGGVYGVAIRGLFAAESMFHTMTDASKVALVFLLERLKERGFSLIDIQMVTPHTQRFGGVEISRAEYLKRLDLALQKNVSFD